MRLRTVALTGLIIPALLVGTLRMFPPDRTDQLPGVIAMSDPFSQDKIFKIVDDINNLAPGQVLHLKITSYGGEVAPTIALITALQNTKGHVIAEVDGMAASAAGIILMYIPEVHASKNSMVLFHEAAMDIGGARVVGTDPFSLFTNDLIKNTLAGMLTPEELKVITDGGDLWLDGQAAAERINAYHVLHPVGN